MVVPHQRMFLLLWLSMQPALSPPRSLPGCSLAAGPHSEPLRPPSYRVLLPAWASGVGLRCCRGARRLAGLVSRRTPRMPSLSSTASPVVKIAASGPSPEAGAAASTPTNKRAILAAVAAVVAGVAALGVVASIMMDGDGVNVTELEEAKNARDGKKSRDKVSAPHPPLRRRWLGLAGGGIPYMRPPFSSFSSESGRAGEPCGWWLDTCSARRRGAAN
jgi:hypothetical protein